MRRIWPSLFIALGMGCGPVVGVDGGEGSTSTSTSTSTAARTSSTGATTMTTSNRGEAGADVTTEAPTTSPVASTSDGATRGSSSTGWDCTMLPICGGKTYECANGRDDDGDGHTDLDDPDCVSVCDDDESALALSIPTELAPGCRVDCFFDGNSGSGDDFCEWNIRCDPLGPAAHLGCAPYGDPPPQRDPICADQPVTPPECVDFCEPFVPNGCDCFGCCTFQTLDGPKNIFLEHNDCTASDGLAGCPECTQHMDLCGNPCEIEACEICVGAQALPAGCDEVGCVGGIPCTEQCDCPMDHACITGCCVPPPPG